MILYRNYIFQHTKNVIISLKLLEITWYHQVLYQPGQLCFESSDRCVYNMRYRAVLFS